MAEAPPDIKARLEAAEEVRKAGRFAEAEGMFQRVREVRPGNVPAILGVARCAIRQNEVDRAAQLFTAAAVQGGFPWPLVELGTEYLKLDRFTEAETCFRHARDIDPDRSEPYVGYAALARRRGDRQGAMEWQRQACARAPDDPVARADLGRDLQELGQLDEARAAFEQVLARKPKMLKALRGAVAVARAQGDEERLLPLLEQLAAADPGAASALKDAIGIHRERGEKEQALQAARSLLQREPNNSAGWVQLGLLERAGGNMDAALAALEQAHERDPANVNTLLQLAREHRTAGNQVRCDELMQLAKRLEPRGGTQVVAQSAEQAMMANDPEAALALYEAGIAANPGHFSLYGGACTALTRLGRTDEAMELLDRARERCGNVPPLHARRAQLLRDTGRYREALELSQAALVAHPGSFLLWEVAARLLLLIGTDAQIAAWLAQAPAVREVERAAVAAVQGEAAALREDLPAAIASFEDAARRQPTNAAHQASLAKAQLSLFALDEASVHLAAQCELQGPATRLQNRSSNPSQTALGQIINEYRLDAAALHLFQTLPAEGAARLPQIQAMCLDYPDSTLAAVGLVDALWHAGALAWRGASPAATAMPRRIVQYWDEASPAQALSTLMDTWPALHPGWAYQRYHDKSARAFLAAEFDREVLFAYHRAAAPALRSDLFRLACLVHGGGVYVDADNRATAPIDDLVSPGATLVLYREDLGTLANDVMACEPGHPIIRMALDSAVETINRGDRDALRLSTGPGLITRCFARAIAADPAAATAATTRIWSRRAMLGSVSLHCAAAFAATAAYRGRQAYTRRGYTIGSAEAAEPAEPEMPAAELPPLMDD